MVRPNNFGFNEKTKYTNPFQYDLKADKEFIKVKAIEEFDDMVSELKAHNLDVLVYEDRHNGSPDAVFLNNSLSVFPNAKAAVYPVFSSNALSKKEDRILTSLKDDLGIKEIYDLSFFEQENKFLESTGSVVFDHEHQVAYASLSRHTNEEVFNYLCKLIGYEGFVFTGYDFKGNPISRTNVILSIGQSYVLACLSCIDDVLERTIIRKKLEQTGRVIIEISMDQMLSFSGNCLEVYNRNGQSKLIISRTGYHALKSSQIEQIKDFSDIVMVNVSIIERIGGGSTGSMILGVNC